MEMNTTVYGKEGCFSCKMAVKWLMQNGFQPAYVDLDEDPDTREMFMLRGIKTLPVVTFDNGQAIVRQTEGFQPDAWRQLKSVGQK